MTSFRYPVDEIREKSDLVEIVSQHVALRKRGRNLVGLCPFHNEKTGSFNVNPENQTWKCFGCGLGGDVFTFVQKIDNLSFGEAAETLARKAGITIERTEQATRQISEKERLLRANNIACAYFKSMLAKSEKAQEYIRRRGMSLDTVENYKLGYAPEGWDGLLSHLTVQRVSQADALKAGLIIARENSPGFYDRFRDRLMFPIFDSSNRVIAFGGRVMGDGEPKYLNSPETPLFAKNKTLYGLNFARRAISTKDRLLVVEGYMDVISTQASGFENSVATMGTALTEEHVNIIARFTHNVILSFDADSAGVAAAMRSYPIFERAGFDVRILSMPRGEDPDSILRGGDSARFASLLDRALPVPDYRIKAALAKYDLNSDEGKGNALKDAIAILAEVDSAMDRERLIRHLAKLHPNFGSGPAVAENHLRAEAAKQRGRGNRQKYIDNRSNMKESGAPVTNPKRKLTLMERTEYLLLGTIILSNFNASKVFDAIPANEFSSEAGQLLAEALSRLSSKEGKIEIDRLRDSVMNTPAENLLTDILVGMDDSITGNSVDTLVETMLNEKRKQRQNRKRELAEKLQAGSITRDDPEYEEYWSLVKDTKGNSAPRVIRRFIDE